MIISLLLLILKLQSLLQLTVSSSSSHGAPPIAKSGCQDQCGGVRIPYPFGIGAGCYHDESYEIICDTSFHPPKPFLHSIHFEVMDINWDGRYSVVDLHDNEMASDQILSVRNVHHNICSSHNGTDLRGSPYRFSRQYNVFLVKGCGVSVVLKNSSREIVTGCASICTKNISKKNMTSCNGVGCCQSSLLSSTEEVIYNTGEGLDFYEIDLNHEALFNPQTCDVAAGLFSGNVSSLKTVLEWGGVYTAAEDLISDKFSCYNGISDFRTCRCPSESDDGYVGNPYLGCQLVGECQKCKHGCGFDRNGPTGQFHCKKNPLFNLASILGFSLGMGLILLLLGCYGLYRVVKKKREVRRKSEYFKRNGGLLLQQQICSSEGAAQRTKVFTVTELEKATDNFNKNRILGQGGQGTVYKGMLKDGRIVAIKKSIKVDENQLEQFINEVVILSEITHRNVVRLLGCCLETEVPLLMYEFIQNGTLYQHIHDASEDFHVTWKMRLQMAAESADAVAYLHSSSSAPIYHRDIKSSNILLDAKYRAKVSDFGTSRSIKIEQTHVTTCVIGTYGYLDPEYFQSQQFTEKSDVYSFGVVLVELITGKKPICPTKDGGWISLAVEFLFHMENSSLSDILDARVLDEGNLEEIVAVANLARQCLNMNGKERPTMKEIALVLDRIRSSHVPYSTEPNSMVGKGVMMEMSDKYSGASSTNTLFSDVSPGGSSTDVQRSMTHTL